MSIVSADDYYPFGLTFNSSERSGFTTNKFLYNQGTGDKQFKTERVTELGLDLDMTKFRMYDPALGRFWQIDPMADQAGQESWTPYQYAFNNPIRYNDPLGDCPPGVDCDDVVKNPRIRATPNSGITGGRFGNTRGRFHNGIDVLASKGTSLKSMHKGSVFAAAEHPKLGHYVIIKSESENETFYTTYAHLNESSTASGDVEMGDEIGKSGKSGNAKDMPKDQEHVHISVKSGEKGTSYSEASFVNPEDYMKTQFDSEGNPDPNKLSAGQVQAIVDFINDAIEKKNTEEDKN